MKKILRISFVIIICLIAAAILKDFIIKSIVSVVTTQVTGAKTEIRGLSFGVFSHSVRIKGFKMYNPEGFSKNILIDLPNVAVNYDLVSLLKGKLHLFRLDIELYQLAVEKNKNDKLNVDSLKVVQQQQRETAKKKPAKPLALQIDLLNLKINKIVYNDYSGAGEKPAVKIYDVSIEKSYKNITSAEQLAVLILTEPMRSAGIKGATIYGISALAGVGMFPAVIAAKFISRDSAQKDFDLAIDNLYNINLGVLKRLGKITKENKAAASLSAVVNGVNITSRLEKINDKKTKITISARKYMLPRPEVAEDILYKISEEVR